METSKVVVATELLDRALRLYFEGGSDFAALHLAGAAEELLGNFAKRPRFRLDDGSTWTTGTGLDSYVEAVQALEDPPTDSDPSDRRWAVDRLNEPRNATKHSGSADVVTFDPRLAAYQMIDRAVISFYAALLHPEFVGELFETANIRRFGDDPRASPHEPDSPPRL